MALKQTSDFDQFNEDPAAEFLEREQRDFADLAADGNQFSSSNVSSQYEAFSQVEEKLNEPEKIRRLREEFAERISKKDAEEETKRKEMREQAKKELDEFYKKRAEQIQRQIEENRSNNETLENDLAKSGAPSNSDGKQIDWEKVTTLCEFNPKTNRSQKDLTRYRTVLLQLKQQQNSIK